MQRFGLEHRAFGNTQTELLCCLLTLAAKRVPDDLVTVTSGAARTLVQLSGDTAGNLVKQLPASAQQCDLALQVGLVHRILFEARGREGETPEVCRRHAD